MKDLREREEEIEKEKERLKAETERCYKLWYGWTF